MKWTRAICLATLVLGLIAPAQSGCRADPAEPATPATIERYPPFETTPPGGPDARWGGSLRMALGIASQQIEETRAASRPPAPTPGHPHHIAARGPCERPDEARVEALNETLAAWLRGAREGAPEETSGVSAPDIRVGCVEGDGRVVAELRTPHAAWVLEVGGGKPVVLHHESSPGEASPLLHTLALAALGDEGKRRPLVVTRAAPLTEGAPARSEVRIVDKGMSAVVGTVLGDGPTQVSLSWPGGHEPRSLLLRLEPPVGREPIAPPQFRCVTGSGPWTLCPDTLMPFHEEAGFHLLVGRDPEALHRTRVGTALSALGLAPTTIEGLLPELRPSTACEVLEIGRELEAMNQVVVDWVDPGDGHSAPLAERQAALAESLGGRACAPPSAANDARIARARASLTPDPGALAGCRTGTCEARRAGQPPRIIDRCDGPASVTWIETTVLTVRKGDEEPFEALHTALMHATEDEATTLKGAARSCRDDATTYLCSSSPTRRSAGIRGLFFLDGTSVVGFVADAESRDVTHVVGPKHTSAVGIVSDEPLRFGTLVYPSPAHLDWRPADLAMKESWRETVPIIRVVAEDSTAGKTLGFWAPSASGPKEIARFRAPRSVHDAEVESRARDDGATLKDLARQLHTNERRLLDATDPKACLAQLELLDPSPDLIEAARAEALAGEPRRPLPLY